MPKTVAVIDGNSLMHRAYHAVPPTMTAPDGTPTNAAFGFLSMLLKFIEMEQPDALVCAFDKGRPKFRMEALEQYKAQRPPMDEELKAQFPVIENLLAAMNVPVVALPGWEGDDILGTVAARDEELGYRTLLVTGDKDAYQLASDLTKIVTTKRGITDVVIYGPEEVEERYGVTPDQFTDFLGLKGDKADNIPGVPGIGDKKAASMLQAYGNLEGIYANLDKFKGKQLENLTNYKDDAFLSRQVATIVRDADFELDLESISFPNFNVEQVTEAFTDVRMMAHLAKILKLQGGEAASIDLGSWDNFIEGDEAKAAIELPAEGYVPVAWALDPQASLFGDGLTLAVNLGDSTALFHDEEAKEALAFLVREREIATADAKSLLQVVFPADTAQDSLVSRGEILDAHMFDVALAAYVADSNNGAATLNALMERYAGAVLPDEKDPQKQVALQAAAIGALVDPLAQELEKEGARKVYDDIDLPLVGVLACMERTGAALDVDHLKALNESTGAEVDRLRAAIYASAGHEFNVDSPKQLSEVLFDELGLTPKKKTRSGYSTNASVLKELTEEHELPGLMLEYREYAKIKSTYIDALPRMRAEDGRVHTSFNEMVTTTGRLSSSDPNLQNIPIRMELGREIRKAFKPKEGCVFLDADYSQIELRVLAHMSGDQELIDAYRHNQDIHRSTASKVFHTPFDQVTDLQRRNAKAVNFGIVYGISSFGLSQDLNVSKKEAQAYIDQYFATYPAVKEFIDSLVATAKEKGYAGTMFGRRRPVPELASNNFMQRSFGERIAMNSPIQGTAADIIKLAMIRVADRLKKEQRKARIVLQVHDELLVEVPEEEVEAVQTILEEEMPRAVELSVPLEVEVLSGKDWKEAH